MCTHRRQGERRDDWCVTFEGRSFNEAQACPSTFDEYSADAFFLEHGYALASQIPTLIAKKSILERVWQEAMQAWDETPVTDVRWDEVRNWRWAVQDELESVDKFIGPRLQQQVIGASL